MQKTVDYNEVFKFMKEFGVDFINKAEELIIDETTNTYVTISGCKDMDDVKTRVVFNLCRPIGKGLTGSDANKLLKRVNDYFDANLTKEDMRLLYREMCYTSKFEEFKSFIKRGFPMNELETSNSSVKSVSAT